MVPQYMAQYYSHDMMDGGDWGWGLLMMLFWLAAIILIVALIIRGVHWQGNAGGKGEDAQEIAKRRYAKGEITKEEFEQLKKDLK